MSDISMKTKKSKYKSDISMKNLFMKTSNKDIVMIDLFSRNMKKNSKKSTTNKTKKFNNYKHDSLEINLNNCDFKKLRTEMKKYEYPEKGNLHHRAGLFHHSIWTAKATEMIFNLKDKNNWIKKLSDGIPKKFHNFSILAAFLHDIGKLDNKTTKQDFIKPKHDIYGYDLLINSCSIFYNFIDKCINPKYDQKFNKVIAFLALISKHHLDLGRIMKKELSIDKYIDNIFKSFGNFPEEIYVFKRDDIGILFNILTIIQLADVIGARPFDSKSKWAMLNEYKKIEEIDEYKKDQNKTPWFRYGYEKNGEKYIDKIIKKYQERINIYFNSEKSGIGSKVNIKTEIIGNKYKIKYSEIPEGVYFFKSMSIKIKPSDHRNYKNISWFGSEKTADIYLENKSFGGFEYQFQTTKKLRLIRLDDTETIISFYAMLNDLYKKEKKRKYLDIANKLQFAFGVGIKQFKELKQYMNKNFFNYDKDFLDIKRKSYHNIDIDIMKELICPFSSSNNFDGYVAKPFFNFHEEIALCTPWEDVKLVKLYKEFDFGKKCKIVYGGKAKRRKNQGKKKLKKIN